MVVRMHNIVKCNTKIHFRPEVEYCVQLK